MQHEILTQNIASEGTMVAGYNYVQFGAEAVTAQQLQALRSLWEQYTIPSAGRLSEVNLSGGWEAVGLGGDLMKMIAINRGLQITAKRYSSESFAWLIFHSYRIVEKVVKKNNFPLLFPVARYGDTIIYPYLEIQGDPVDVSDDHRSKLYRMCEELSLDGIYIPAKLKKFELTDGNVVYTDPFMDGVQDLEYALENLGRGFNV